MDDDRCGVHVIPNYVFILSGQSNMSGRGGVHAKHWDEVIPPEYRSDPSILRFSASSKWVRAHDPLHADIEVNKTCGVGPGMPFANSLLPHLPSSPSPLIGLVPCAIGGTAISEWERGGHLYSQMLARSKRSVAHCQAGAEAIKAVLWYQGESDTDTEERSHEYKARMERLIDDFRADLGVPLLPFIQMALASGVKEELMEEVREAQLAIDLPNVVCVDAKGLPLNADNLHLTTGVQVVLGKMLADAYVGNFCNP